VVGWVDEINEVASIASTRKNIRVFAYDEFVGLNKSILDGLRIKTAEHSQAPPTLHPKIELEFDYPHGWTAPPTFLLWTSEETPDLPLKGTTIVASFDKLKTLAVKKNLDYFVIAVWQDTVAVRVYLP